MTGQQLVDMIRKDREELWNEHLLWVETKGEQGVQCLTIDKMQALLNESDEDIIRKGLINGVYISDLEKYNID